MDQPISDAYKLIDELASMRAILNGRVRSSINNHGETISVWIEADQVIEGRGKVKNVHLRHPETGEDLIGRAPILNGAMEPAFTVACTILLNLIDEALGAHNRLKYRGLPTWGCHYKLPEKVE